MAIDSSVDETGRSLLQATGHGFAAVSAFCFLVMSQVYLPTLTHKMTQHVVIDIPYIDCLGVVLSNTH